MKQLFFTFQKNGRYKPELIMDIELGNIYLFLEMVGIDNREEFREIERNEKFSMGYNILGVLRLGDFVCFESDFDDSNTIVRMSVQNFKNMVDEWVRLEEEKTPFIRLSWDGEKVTFEAIDEIKSIKK